MSFEKQDFIDAGMDIDDVLSANCGVEWLNDNTTIEIDFEDSETLQNMPNVAKLFIIKFTEFNSTQVNSLVTSESIVGMSQSFRTDSVNTFVWDLANQLLSKYLKSNLKVFVNKGKWY